MIKSRIAVAGALFAVAGAVNAGISVTPTIATDYDFRGISQTNPDGKGFDPAFQLGATYTADSGFYAGVWGSNVNFGVGDPNVEVDFTVGFAGGDAAGSFGYDIGANYYAYVDTGSLNTVEFYAGISKSFFSGKLWYSDDYGTSDKSGYYLEGNGAFPLPMDFTLLAHVGIADGKYLSKSQTDLSIGVGKSFGNFDTSLKYVDGSTKNEDFDYDNRLVFSISTTLPWSE